MKTFALLNIIGYLGTLVLNGLANALPINGYNTGQLSDMYPNLFVPAGLTFSIWGVIYLLLGIFVVFQAIVAFSSGKNNAFVQKIGPWFFISCLANMSWILAWHYQFVPLSLVIMLGILGSLIMIYQRLEIGRKSAGGSEKFLVHLTFSIYLGWITVATIANVTTLLVDIGWAGFGLEGSIWTVIVMVVALAIGLTIAFRRNDIFFPLVLIWAFFGIYIKRTALDPELFQNIIYTSIAGMVILGLAAVIQVVRGKIYA
jgi:hypothetical protein